jgi:hypothetical protein
VASPVTSVEEQHRAAAGHPVRQAERGAVHGKRLKLGEALPNAKSFHSRTHE